MRREGGSSAYFNHELAPIMSPIGLDPAHPFPDPLNKSLAFIVNLKGKDAFGRNSGKASSSASGAAPRGAAPRILRRWAQRVRPAFLHHRRPHGRAFSRHARHWGLPVPGHAQQRSVRGRRGGGRPAAGVGRVSCRHAAMAMRCVSRWPRIVRRSSRAFLWSASTCQRTTFTAATGP